MRKLILLFALVLPVGCGDDGGTAPTAQIPSVSGNYTGNTTYSVPGANLSFTCPTTATVSQSGATVNIGAVVLGGACNNQSMPFGPVTIDNTGSFPSMSTTLNQTCGVYTATFSGGFSARELRLSVTASSTTCPSFGMTMTLSR